MIPERLRRPIAIVALVGGVGAALLTLHRDVATVQVVFLLTHVAHDVGGAHLERDRLVGLVVEGHDGRGPWRIERSYRRGRAPEATAAYRLELGPDVDKVTLRCRFDAGGAEPVQSATAVRVERREGLQVVDAGSCSVPAP